MSALRHLEVPDFELQRGGRLPLARLAYRTLGTLNAARDNAVLVPIGFSGDDEGVEAIMTGPGRALDPSELFIVLVNQTGSGRSSSPSTTPPPFDRGRFPRVTLHDNVRLQHRLVTQELGIERLRLVTGWSMGGAQCYQWGAQHPDAVRALAPIAGSARTAVYNRVFLYALRRTLTLDPAFRDGEYETPPLAGLHAFATIYAGWGLSEPFYRQRAYEALGAVDLEDFVRQFWEPHFAHCDANDLLSQLWTWEHTDISDDPRYGGDLDAALGAIQARTIVLPVDQDRYFPPGDAQAEVARMPNAECRVLRSDWGHYAPRNPADWPVIDAALRELLEG